jgi:hypothetical protein
MIQEVFEATGGPCDHLETSLKALKAGDARIATTKKAYTDLLASLQNNRANHVYANKALAALVIHSFVPSLL